MIYENFLSNKLLPHVEMKNIMNNKKSQSFNKNNLIESFTSDTKSVIFNPNLKSKILK